jgi:hypothetical protein
MPDPRVNPCHSYGGDIFRLPATPVAPSAAAGAAALPAAVLEEQFEPVPIPFGGLAVPIDAVLGVEGVPQSATGQTTLLTGVNAQELLGKHLTGFPNPPLRELLLQKSVLRTLTDRGLHARFLNVFRPLYFELPYEKQITLSATTVANLAAANRFSDLNDLRNRQAIYQEFTNQELVKKGFDVPEFTPTEAGVILAQQARQHDFLLFEYFKTDQAGHSQDFELAHLHLRRLDEFLIALLGELQDNDAAHPGGQKPGHQTPSAARGHQTDTLVVLTSDHGNIEDLSTKRHTTNPVPLLAWGPSADRLVRKVRLLSEVSPALVKLLTGGDRNSLI